ncbi:hypothetical protein [Flavobacterium sp. JP2137]|uniref:hypothetical protein n=1 Tax=Flavobacterium sp. JP2137 TaxID=3414510 RepID=UPI003D300084
MKISKNTVGVAFGSVLIVSLMLLFRKKLETAMYPTPEEHSEKSEPSSKFIIDIVELQERLRDISDLTHYRIAVPNPSPLKEYCEKFDRFLTESSKNLDHFSSDNTLGLQWKLTFDRSKPSSELLKTKYKKLLEQGDNAVITSYLNFFKSSRETLNNLIQEAPNQQTKAILFNLLKSITTQTEDLLLVISGMLTEQQQSVH